jgi:hypothetical protein
MKKAIIKTARRIDLGVVSASTRGGVTGGLEAGGFRDKGLQLN